MFDSIVFVFAVWATFVVFTGVVPWLARTTSVYALHEVRDAVYAMRDRAPVLRGTKVYQLLEFISTSAIHCVRERPIAHAFAIASIMVRGEDEPVDVDPDFEGEVDRIMASAAGRAELAVAMRKMDRIPLWVTWRAMWSNPIALLIVSVTMVIAVFDYMKRRRSEPRAKIARAVRLASRWPKEDDGPRFLPGILHWPSA
jgi:hypothetical protein